MTDYRLLRESLAEAATDAREAKARVGMLEAALESERAAHAETRADLERALAIIGQLRVGEMRIQLEQVASLELELEAADRRRREGRGLLRRLVKYVREDRAETPGSTRLARLTDTVDDYLRRTHDPADILRDSAKPPPSATAGTADEGAGLTCPHCLEPLVESEGVEGPHGNLWHYRCLESWRESDD